MKLNELLGTEFPIIQGGMANIATGEFAAACSNAGALGMIATGGWDAARLRTEIRRAKELTDKPFGVNLMLMSPYADEIAQVILEEGVKVVTTGAGNPGKYIPAWKAAGIKVMPVVAAGAGESSSLCFPPRRRPPRRFPPTRTADLPCAGETGLELSGAVVAESPFTAGELGL